MHKNININKHITIPRITFFLPFLFIDISWNIFFKLSLILLCEQYGRINISNEGNKNASIKKHSEKSRNSFPIFFPHEDIIANIHETINPNISLIPSKQTS